MEEVGGSPRRRAAFDRDWTKGSLTGNLLTLAWPMMITGGLNLMGPTIDMIWVGKLGTASIAGVGVAGTVVMLVMSAMAGLITGARAMVARFIGAGDAEGANHVAQQAFVISIAFATVVASIGFFFSETILNLLGVEADVVAEGAAYMRIMFLGSVTMSLRFVADGIMQASGDTVTPMKITVFYRLFHVALAPFLIFGWWLFPHLGVSGAALSNVISQSLGTALGLWFLFSGRTRLRLTLSKFRFDPNIVWRIARIGLPAAVMGMERSLGRVVLVWFMVPFGTLAVAAHTLMQRIEMMMHQPGMGLGVAAGVLAGQNLGARQPQRAERSGWLAAGLVEVAMLVSSVAILLWAENIIGIFSSEPALVKIASAFLRIEIIGYLVLGFSSVLQYCISGAGDTLPPMLVTLLNVWLVQVPLAFFLPRVTDLGVYGVRWAIVSGLVAAAVAYVIYFRLGRWKHKKV